MNPAQREAWKSQLLDEIFKALARSPALEQALVFKGARVLRLRLGVGRQSLDIDSNLLSPFVERFPGRNEQRAFLEQELTATIERYFAEQEPARYRLTGLRVTPRPEESHPLGWNAFLVQMKVDELTRNVRGLPALEIDVAAPEELLDSSMSPIRVGDCEVRAYTLERMTGEKLRAFLSSLPAYRAKVNKPGKTIRAKDLYDLALVRRARPLADRAFWHLAAQEFRLACRSRFVDSRVRSSSRVRLDAEFRDPGRLARPVKEFCG